MSAKDKYWIAFSSIENINSKFILKLYEHFKDIELAWNCSDLSFYDGLNIQKAENFLRLRDKTSPDKMMNIVADKNLQYLTYEQLPFMLKEIYDAPATVYYRGDLKTCNLDKTLAIVGSRRATTACKDILAKMIAELSNTDICIVSGLAAGVDTVAHQSAIKNGLKTIGVIASGHDYVYPTNNRELYRTIENGNGVVLSEYFPTIEPLRFHFPQRNRIVTGLSYGTLVAEASLKSGALISANLCLEQGRELMCIPGLISNPNTQGIYKLLKNGATLVTCAEDILTALNWDSKKEAKQMTLALNTYNENQNKILKCLELEPKVFDIILSETGINAEELMVLLTELELDGVIKQTDGERYKTV